MAVLKRIQNDGTFNQPEPLKYLLGHSHCYSYDLKYATDRWPLHFLYVIMIMLFGPSLASSIVNTTLGFNVFDVLFTKTKRFTAGQPLGYYASWPLFSLSHHFLVWYAAEQVHPFERFTKYAILGDAVVIADKRVASFYVHCLEKLGFAKPKVFFFSNSGAFEFAKRFRVKRGLVDLSPISIRSLLTFHHPFGLMAKNAKYPIRSFTTLVRIGGGGYKVLAKLDHHRSRHHERLYAMYTKPRGNNDYPFEFCLGRGQPLSPYLRGYLINYLLLIAQ